MLTNNFNNLTNMIKIKSTDAYHQYDKEGRAITTWDHKKCSWIINSEVVNS